jgi:hypothetical protein
MAPRPGGYDNAGNRRPRTKSPARQARCGHWVGRVSGRTVWCEDCGADCGPAGPGGKGACDCFAALKRGQRRLALRLTQRWLKLQLGIPIPGVTA